MPEAPVTEELNSTPISTDAPAPTDNPSSTTQQADPAADPLDAPSLLGDAPAGDPPAADPADPAADPADPAPAEATELIGAPEGDYDLTGLLEEGQAVDAEALEAIAPLAKELNLSNAGLAKLAAEAQPIIAKQMQDAAINDVLALRNGWDIDSRAAINGGTNTDGVKVAKDPAFGGQPYEAVVNTAAKAIDRACGDKQFPAAKADGSPGTFRDFLKSTGLGNHPAMVQFAYWAGTRISEDGDLPRGGGVPPQAKTREEKYYPA